MHLHPFFAHFPVALIPTAFFLQGIHLWRPNWTCRVSGFWLTGIAILFSFLSNISGERSALAMDTSGLPSEALLVLQRHQDMANLVTWAALALFLFWISLFFRDKKDKRVDVLGFAFLGLLSLAMLAVGYLGGQLVHTFGASAD